MPRTGSADVTSPAGSSPCRRRRSRGVRRRGNCDRPVAKHDLSPRLVAELAGFNNGAGLGTFGRSATGDGVVGTAEQGNGVSRTSTSTADTEEPRGTDSWLVTAERDDACARAHPYEVELSNAEARRR